MPSNTTFHLASKEEKTWWNLTEFGLRNIFDDKDGFMEEQYLSIIAFNDRVAPAGLSFFTGYGWVTHIYSLYFKWSHVNIFGLRLQKMCENNHCLCVGLQQQNYVCSCMTCLDDNLHFLHLKYVCYMYVHVQLWTQHCKLTLNKASLNQIQTWK